MERTAHDPIPGAPCKPSKIKAFRRFDSTFRIRFRVGAVMTASIPLRIFLLPHSPRNRREQQERTGYSIRALRPLDALCRQDFPSAAFRDGHTISSQPRYDRFDTSPRHPNDS